MIDLVPGCNRFFSDTHAGGGTISVTSQHPQFEDNLKGGHLITIADYDLLGVMLSPKDYPFLVQGRHRHARELCTNPQSL